MMKYHAHVYFDVAQIQAIEALYAQLQHDFGTAVQYGRIHQKCVGPHTQPMFQLAFDEGLLAQMKDFLHRHTAVGSVLIHPLHDNEYLAHTQDAQWLGEVLPLYLDIFEQSSR